MAWQTGIGVAASPALSSQKINLKTYTPSGVASGPACPAQQD